MGTSVREPPGRTVQAAPGPQAGNLGARLTGYRATLQHRDFRILWIAAVISRGGDAINFVALPVFAYSSSRSAAAVAGLVAIEGAALIAGGAAAHLVVDRLRPRRLLVGIDVIRATAALLLAALPSYPTAVAVAAVLALGTSWFSPTSAALIPRLVPREALASANALLWTAGVALQLVAAPLGGLLVTAAPARIAFALNALSFAGSALVLERLPRWSPPPAATSPWRQLPEALRAVPSIPILPPLLLTQGLAAAAAGATSALLVVLAEQAYGLTGTVYGAWLAVVGAAALLGPLATRAARLPALNVLGAAYIVRGLGDLGLGALSSGLAGAGLLVVYGLATSSGTVAYQTLVQESVPESLRGRAFALLDVVWQCARLLSIASGGALAAAVGVRPVFAVGGILLVAAGVVGVLGLRRGLAPSQAAQPAPHS